MERLKVGDAVRRVNSDYRYDGHIVAKVVKLNGTVRYVVEDDRGTLFIMKDTQLEKKEKGDA